MSNVDANYLHIPFRRTVCGAVQMHAGGVPQGGAVGHAGMVGVGVAVGVAVGVGVGVPLGLGVGVGVAVAVGVGVFGSGDGVAVGPGEPLPDGLSEGGAPASSFQTVRSGLMFESSGTVVTVGGSNVGIPSPPYNIATVPAGEIKITFEFDAFAVSGVQSPLQKNSNGIVATGTESGLQSLINACPR